MLCLYYTEAAISTVNKEETTKRKTMRYKSIRLAAADGIVVSSSCGKKGRDIVAMLDIVYHNA